MFAQEFRHARLLFTRNPGVATAAVLALAIGIAGNSAIFSIVNSVLIEPLPYPESRRMIAVLSVSRTDPHFIGSASIPDFHDWEAQSRTLEDWTLYITRDVSAQAGAGPFTLSAVYITRNALPLTGSQPIAGVLPPAGSPEDPTRVYISSRLWASQFHSDPAVIGRDILVEGTPRRVTAVLPEGFNLGYRYYQGDMWIPTAPPANVPRGDHVALCLARLRPGVTLDQAQAEMHRLADRLSRQYPETNGEWTVGLRSFQSFMTMDVSTSLWILLAAVLMVQLIVCTNVAGLLLSRAAERAQETAIRIALGASLNDIGRQCLAEGLSLALTACVLGTLIGFLAIGFPSAFGPHLPVTTVVRFSWRVALFNVLLSLLTGLLASLAPWWQARFIRSGELLKEGSRTTASLQRRRLLRVFAGIEIALSLVLLIAAGLLGDQLRTIDSVRLGFDPVNLYAVQLDVPFDRHRGDDQLASFYTEILDRASRLRGVQTPALISMLAPDWGNNSTVFPDGIVTQQRQREFVEFRSVSRSYFTLLDRRFLQGRAPVPDDLKSPREQPVVVNETAAHSLWPSGSALGRRLKWGDPKDAVWFRVIGIVADMRNAGPRLAPRPEGDFLFQQRAERQMFLVVRSKLPQARVGQLLRDVILAADPAVSVGVVENMPQRIGRGLGNLRFQAILLSVFSLFALILAIVGVYSVMSYTVSQRTMEIGIRLAIGADPFRTLRLILRDGLKLALVSASIGLAIALVIAYFLRQNPALGIEVRPLSIVSAYVVIVIASTVACFLPARRAALVDPMVALRPETPWSPHASLRRLRALPQLFRLPIERFRGDAEFDRQWLARLAETTAGATGVAAVLEEAVRGLRRALQAANAALFVRTASGSMGCIAADGIEDATALTGLSVDSFVVRRLRRLIHPLAFDEQDLLAWEHFSAAASPETRLLRDEEIRTLRAAGAVLLVPVWLRGDLLALLAFGPRTRPYDELDFQPLQVAATQLAFVIENGRLLERVAAEERTRQELALAARVQRRLFPETALHVGRLELAGDCHPARTIGGDYYDFLELPDGHIGIALADVAGKGIAAALLTSVIQASVRSLAPDPGRPLSELVVRINQLLYQSTESHSYATFFYANFDPAACTLTYVNAGHNPPYFLRLPAEEAEASGSLLVETAAPVITELAASGPIIGLLKTVAYEQSRIDLRAGDLLVLFTDGIPEALNTAEDEYGEDRLRDLVLTVRDEPADTIAKAILDDVHAFIGEAAQYDDMTVLVLKVK